MATKIDNKIIDDYLSLFKIDDSQYIIGIFQEGITIFKQQVRALNIFYGLLKSGVLRKTQNDSKDKCVPPMQIAIIGGGVAGLTFAAAALKAGFEVIIFEEKPMFMHMQHGCETRKVHPNIYDWPADNSDNIYAKLPVLSWKYDTASNVAQQIKNSFEAIAAEAGKNRYTPYFNCKIDRIKWKDDLKKLEITVIKEDHGAGYINADILIFAPGYGVERGTSSISKTPSYWRNDDFAQPLLTKKARKFFISGFGDGGLIDLFRIKITGFGLLTLLRTIENNPKSAALISALKEIRTKWKDPKAYPKFSLLDEFLKIPEEMFGYIIDGYFEKRKTAGADVFLIGKEDHFEDNLDLNRISLLNAFIVWILKKKGSYFDYLSQKQFRKHNKVGILIERHGTNKEKVLKDLGFKMSTINKLSKTQKNHALYNNDYQLWEFHEIIECFEDKPGKKVEFLRSESVAICSSFISILSNQLNYYVQKSGLEKKGFRISLHRIINPGEKPGYQQITSAFETREVVSKGSLGVYYEFERGNVGLSARYGIPTLIINKENGDFSKILEVLNLGEHYNQKPQRAFLTLPVLARLGDNKLATNLVLYVDAEDPNFFDNEEIIPRIYYSVKGFIDSIKRLLKSGHIHMTRLTFEPQEVDNDISSLTFLNQVEIPYSDSKTRNYGLEFDQFYSFDIIHNHPADFTNFEEM